MNEDQKRNFHDSVITQFKVANGRLELEIENVWISDSEPLESGILIVDQLCLLMENGTPLSLISCSPGLEDGQILQLEMNDKTVKMTVEWESYSPARKEYAEYQVEGENVSWFPSEKERPIS